MGLPKPRKIGRLEGPGSDVTFVQFALVAGLGFFTAYGLISFLIGLTTELLA